MYMQYAITYTHIHIHLTLTQSGTVGTSLSVTPLLAPRRRPVARLCVCVLEVCECVNACVLEVCVCVLEVWTWMDSSRRSSRQAGR